MTSDPLMFQLVQARLSARIANADFPPSVTDHTGPLMAEAEHHLRAARSAYARVAEIHRDNENQRLKALAGAS